MYKLETISCMCNITLSEMHTTQCMWGNQCMWLTMWIISMSSGSTIGPFRRSSSSNLIPCLSISNWEGREGSLVSRRWWKRGWGSERREWRERDDTHTHVAFLHGAYDYTSNSGHDEYTYPLPLSHAHTSSSFRHGLHMASASTSIACGRAKDRKERE